MNEKVLPITLLDHFLHLGPWKQYEPPRHPGCQSAQELQGRPVGRDHPPCVLRVLRQATSQLSNLGLLVRPAREDLDLDEDLCRRQSLGQVRQGHQGRRGPPPDPDESAPQVVPPTVGDLS